MVRGPFLQVPIVRYAEMLAINVTGAMLCSFHALPAMIRRRYGRIINLSSQLATLGAIGGGGFAAYAATKGAINALTKALAHEVGPHGITVNAIAPGSIETDMSRDVMTPEFKARRRGRPGQESLDKLLQLGELAPVGLPRRHLPQARAAPSVIFSEVMDGFS